MRTPISSLVILLLGCSDYELQTAPERADPLPPGALHVTPDVVSLWHCGAPTTSEVTLANLGPGRLTVADLTTEGDWLVVAAPELPADLGADDTALVAVEGLGSGVLVIHSDDPDQPTWTVPLEALADAAPEVTVVQPTDGAALPATGDVNLVATVEDILDVPTSLSVSWASDLDGPLGTSGVDATGTTTFTWSGSRTAGTHTLTATVVDACDLVGEAQVAACIQTSIEAEELDISTWQVEGSARWDTQNDWLELTTAVPWLVGSGFQTGFLAPADDVEIRFQFYIGDGTGADGISITALDASRMTSFLGGSGCGIGFGGNAPCTTGPALPGWTIEVDTYYNPEVDPTAADHVQFYFDGDLSTTQTWVALPEMEDTGWHEMVIQVIAPWVLVQIDGITYIDEPLYGHYAFDGYVGFTAGTGGDTNTHLIDSLVVTEMTCPE